MTEIDYATKISDALTAVNAAKLTNQEAHMVVNFLATAEPDAIVRALEFIDFDRKHLDRWHAWRGCPRADDFDTALQHDQQCRTCTDADDHTALLPRPIEPLSALMCYCEVGAAGHIPGTADCMTILGRES
jgi:hypothetical protein